MTVPETVKLPVTTASATFKNAEVASILAPVNVTLVLLAIKDVPTLTEAALTTPVEYTPEEFA